MSVAETPGWDPIVTLIDRVVVPALLDRLLQHRAVSEPRQADPASRVESQRPA